MGSMSPHTSLKTLPKKFWGFKCSPDSISAFILQFWKDSPWELHQEGHIKAVAMYVCVYVCVHTLAFHFSVWCLMIIQPGKAGVITG